MFALPGQVVLLEMAITGSSIVAIVLAVNLTSRRFITAVSSLKCNTQRDNGCFHVTVFQTH